jgi:hypothetical protein
MPQEKFVPTPRWSFAWIPAEWKRKRQIIKIRETFTGPAKCFARDRERRLTNHIPAGWQKLSKSAQESLWKDRTGAKVSAIAPYKRPAPTSKLSRFKDSVTRAVVTGLSPFSLNKPKTSGGSENV